MTRLTGNAVLRWLDAGAVLLLAGWAQIQVWGSDTTWQGGTFLHGALAALITVPLLVRRHRPLPVFLAVAVAASVQFALGGGLGQPWLAMLLALYALGAHAERTPSLAGPAWVLGVVVLVDVPRLADGVPVDEVVPAWFVLGGVWSFGRWMRRRRTEAQSMAGQLQVAQRDREARAAQAVAEERARIARELHDLVAHSMGIIVIQAQGAQRSLPHDPDRVAFALGAIESTGRNGMAEMRRLLSLLAAPEQPDATTPQPGLDRIPDLVGQVRSAGLDVELSLVGEERPVPPGVGLATYRIVQEALTNTLKHAGSASAQVCVRHHADRVEVEVRDTGRAPTTPRPGAGHGLVGMRERVALYGGTLEAGPADDGGFRVRALIPVHAVPS